MFFIVNPIAGGKDKTKLLDIINHEIDKDKFSIKICVSQNKDHMSDLIDFAIQADPYAIIAVGGDGTVNQTGSKIVKSRKRIILGIIPAGSGNGLAKHLKIPSHYVKACKVINDLYCNSIDIININDFIALNMLGAGFEALIAQHFSKNNHKRGLINYIKLVIKLYRNYEPIKINLTLHNNFLIEEKCFSVNVSNGSQFGNNVFIAPCADIKDGLLNIKYLKR